MYTPLVCSHAISCHHPRNHLPSRSLHPLVFHNEPPPSCAPLHPSPICAPVCVCVCVCVRVCVCVCVCMCQTCAVVCFCRTCMPFTWTLGDGTRSASETRTRGRWVIAARGFMHARTHTHTRAQDANMCTTSSHRHMHTSRKAGVQNASVLRYLGRHAACVCGLQGRRADEWCVCERGVADGGMRCARRVAGAWREGVALLTS